MKTSLTLENLFRFLHALASSSFDLDFFHLETLLYLQWSLESSNVLLDTPG